MLAVASNSKLTLEGDETKGTVALQRLAVFPRLPYFQLSGLGQMCMFVYVLK